MVTHPVSSENTSIIAESSHTSESTNPFWSWTYKSESPRCLNNSTLIQALSAPVKSTSLRTNPSSQFGPYPDHVSPEELVFIIPDHMKLVGLFAFAAWDAALLPDV